MFCTGSPSESPTANLNHTNNNKINKQPVSSQKHKHSTFQTHPWIETVNGGYLCKLCSKYCSQKTTGKWITVPIPVSVSRKLYSKAKKHAVSAVHLMSSAAYEARCETCNDVITQLAVKSNAQTERKVSKIYFVCLDWHFFCFVVKFHTLQTGVR